MSSFLNRVLGPSSFLVTTSDRGNQGNESQSLGQPTDSSLPTGVEFSLSVNNVLSAYSATDEDDVSSRTLHSVDHPSTSTSDNTLSALAFDSPSAERSSSIFSFIPERNERHPSPVFVENNVPRNNVYASLTEQPPTERLPSLSALFPRHNDNGRQPNQSHDTNHHPNPEPECPVLPTLPLDYIGITNHFSHNEFDFSSDLRPYVRSLGEWGLRDLRPETVSIGPHVGGELPALDDYNNGHGQPANLNRSTGRNTPTRSRSRSPARDRSADVQLPPANQHQECPLGGCSNRVCSQRVLPLPVPRPASAYSSSRGDESPNTTQGPSSRPTESSNALSFPAPAMAVPASVQVSVASEAPEPIPAPAPAPAATAVSLQADSGSAAISETIQQPDYPEEVAQALIYSASLTPPPPIPHRAHTYHVVTSSRSAAGVLQTSSVVSVLGERHAANEEAARLFVGRAAEVDGVARVEVKEDGVLRIEVVERETGEVEAVGVWEVGRVVPEAPAPALEGENAKERTQK